ncbi:G2/mitotic-specific cyclin-B [Vairimorpha necatrix]|uniref:G2/mitotic-specific cyclin-B n=1 Tax=Vairimorpha necatrix TaxID=6039 RepID=A0AAX4J981_9MICR
MSNLFKKSAPLKNITNISKDKSSQNLSNDELIIYKSHLAHEKQEICMVHKYDLDIFLFYKNLDRSYKYKNNEISFTSRSKMIDWIIYVHNRLNLAQDTLFLTVFIIDKFLIKKDIPKNKLYLVGISALMIACKFEEVICPTLNNLVVLSDNKITEDDIKKAEKFMLHILDYDILFSNPLNFLRRCSKANNYEKKSRTVAKYILELSVLYEDLLIYKNSIKAASAMYLARKITQQDTCKNLFTLYSGHSKEELRECFNKMIQMIAEPIKYEYIKKKYDTQKYNFVSSYVSEYAKQNFY